MIRRVALVLWVAGIAGACGKSDKTGKGTAGASASGKDGGAEGTDGAVTDGAEKVADGEPRVPPPPPTVKPGGKGNCKTEYAPRPTRDPNPMCKIEGGTFVMGAPEGSGTLRYDHFPQRKVTVSSFYIDQFEVTAAQVAHYLNATGAIQTCRNPFIDDHDCFQTKPPSSDSNLYKKDGRFFPRPGADTLPMGSATFEGARQYCEWTGKTLVTEAQWEYAARHDSKTGRDLLFSWGNTFQANRANCNDQECKDGFDWWGAPVGTFDGTSGRGNGASPWGAHDLAGNAAEYVLGCYEISATMCPSDGCVDPVDLDENAKCKFVTRGGGEQSKEFIMTWRRASSAGFGEGFRCARRE